ncbi:DUF4340 domain-containing protein [Petroclostridium sp. X23]|uniref:DUF4340 domain-containing protein n=1 Tax=Petroclostridium sp. X23 TaxID=3045146 RepID=UPI0024ADEC52|nr:DUF4340 domain-containing protein [Petroclostridium sp. X23]WHH60237.1 DUF4340 domain-containing protein [Petroclostridium sp. X23]
MKLYKNTIILVVVLVLLGGAYYFISQNKSKDQSGENKTITLFEMNKDKISEININNATGDLIFKKQGDDWVIEGASDVKLDQVKIESMVWDVTFIEAEQVVEENAQDLDKFGLKTPGAAVTIRSADQSDATLLIGDKLPSKTGYYVKMKDSQGVYTMASSKGETFLNGLDDYKDVTASSEESENK